LHLPHQVVFVCNFVLNLLKVFRGLAEVLFLEVVFFLVGGQLWSSENVLDSVGDDEVFVRNEAVDGLFIFLGDWGFLKAGVIFLLLH